MYERTPTLPEAVAAFLDDLALEGRSQATITSYRYQLRRLDGPLTGFDPPRCRALIAERARTGKPSSLATYRGVLASFGAWCVRHGYLTANPVKDIPWPRVRQNPHRFLSKDELRRLWEAAQTSKRPAYRTSNMLIVLLLMEGLRASELCGVRRQDIAGDECVIRGKGGYVRKIVLSPAVLALVAALPERPTVIGITSRQLWRRVRALGKAARIPHLHPHLLRHSFASHALLEGMDALTLQTYGGWQSDVMVKRYARSALQQSALRRARDFGLAKRLLDGDSPGPIDDRDFIYSTSKG